MSAQQEVFNREVRALLVRHGIKIMDLEEPLGLSRLVLYGRFQGRIRWRMEEVARLLEFLKQYEPDLTAEDLLQQPVSP